MTAVRWEYLVVIHDYTYRFDEKNERIWVHEYSVYHPEASEPELRQSATLVNILDEVGRRGWELVSETVLLRSLYTHNEVKTGMPARTRYIFKRADPAV